MWAVSRRKLETPRGKGCQPGQASEVRPCHMHEVQQGHVQGPASGSRAIPSADTG